MPPSGSVSHRWHTAQGHPAHGARAAERFARYNQAVEEATPGGRFHVLALVGVRPAWQGRGVGSRLVGWTGELCDADPGSLGVVLDTGSDANVRS